MAKSARAIAILALIELETNHTSLATVLDKLWAANHLASVDRQLTHAILATTLRRREEIDVVLDHFCHRPLTKLKCSALAALRVGGCQLLCLDKIPPSAAVNETIKGMGHQPKWLKGFVNGTLRAIARQPQQAKRLMLDLPWPQRSNHPPWLVDLLIKQYGQGGAKTICANNNRQPTLSLRLNSRLTTPAAYTKLLKEKAIVWQAGPLPLSLHLPNYHGPINKLPGYSQGLFYVQDIGAQLIGELFAPFPAGAYLDACAGLGGKTILLDQLLPDPATITALEPHHGRFNLLAANLHRCHCRPISCIHQDLAHFTTRTNQPKWQGILVDAPCSGLGIMGRHPDIRWNRQAEDLPLLQQQQQELLQQAATILRPGGTLVYATCSLARQENNQVIAHFLQTHHNFAIIPPSAPAVQPFLSKEGFFHCLPRNGNDGFFACALQSMPHT